MRELANTLERIINEEIPATITLYGDSGDGFLEVVWNENGENNTFIWKWEKISTDFEAIGKQRDYEFNGKKIFSYFDSFVSDYFKIYVDNLKDYGFVSLSHLRNIATRLKIKAKKVD